MSDETSTRVKFNKKLKFEVGKPKLSKLKGRDNGGSERGTFKRRSKDEIDGNGGHAGENSDLKRKRVYADRGGGGEKGDGGASERKSFSRKGPRGGEKDEGVKRRIREKKDISEYDRLNRVKFSSSRGGNAEKSDAGERRSRKKEEGSWRDYKGKVEKLGGNRSFDREERGAGAGADRLNSKIRSRERFVSSKQDGDGNSDSKFKSQVKVRERWPNRDEVSNSKTKTKDTGTSTKRGDDGESDSRFTQGKPRDRWPSTNRDGDSKSTSIAKTRDRHGLDDDLEKQHSRNRSDKQVDQKPSGRREETPLEKSMKKMMSSKKYAEEDSLMDGPPKKKKKKRLGIHPYDISTKRMDDGISIDGKPIEKKVDPDNDTEISKNAQFRAIQPSFSILSFVEENLLGRRRTIDFKRAGYNIDLSAPLDNIPMSTSSERERIEEAVFRNKLEFTAAAKVSSSFPTAELPEIAFAGRSNVGKSSLLNALTRQWGVVRTSDKPGLTQTINFFKLGSKLCMVDLPGYGFAYAKEEVKDAWEELVKEYVSTRVGLKRVCLLIDTKWGMKPRDQELINLMERSQTKYQIVLTKTDTVFPIDVARRAMQIEESLKANKSVVQPLMMVSSTTGGGIRSLRRVLAQFTRFAKL